MKIKERRRERDRERERKKKKRERQIPSAPKYYRMDKHLSGIV